MVLGVCCSLGGPSAAISKTELFLVPVQTKMSHGCPCFQCLWACLVGGWSHWLCLQGSSRRGLYSCVSLIPCLPFRSVCLLEHRARLTLLPITYLWIDLHPETFEDRQVLYTLSQLHRALQFPPNQYRPFVPGLSEG